MWGLVSDNAVLHIQIRKEVCWGMLESCNAPSPCAKVCNAATYQKAQRSKGLDQIHRDTVFFDALFGSIFDLEITVPFYSEHCVLHLDRREERRGTEVTKFSTRGGILSSGNVVYIPRFIYCDIKTDCSKSA